MEVGAQETLQVSCLFLLMAAVVLRGSGVMYWSLSLAALILKSWDIVNHS